jgi:hypothetical protein
MLRDPHLSPSFGVQKLGERKLKACFEFFVLLFVYFVFLFLLFTSRSLRLGGEIFLYFSVIVMLSMASPG